MTLNAIDPVIHTHTVKKQGIVTLMQLCMGGDIAANNRLIVSKYLAFPIDRNSISNIEYSIVDQGW